MLAIKVLISIARFRWCCYFSVLCCKCSYSRMVLYFTD